MAWVIVLNYEMTRLMVVPRLIKSTPFLVTLEKLEPNFFGKKLIEKSGNKVLSISDELEN